MSMETAKKKSQNKKNSASPLNIIIYQETFQLGMEERFIGLILALASSFLIGSSFIITKKGLIASRVQGVAADGHEYLQNSLWWSGMIVMVFGEMSNFAAYSYAPAILVTPLGALSVLISAVLASIFLQERLGRDGIIGCALAIIGSVLIVMNAPEETKVSSIEEMLGYALKPGFLTYSLFVVFASAFLIFYVSPRHGKKNALVYITICSLVGSITVIACKALGIALKLTFEGDNQLIYFSTYVFIIVVAVCIIVQMNYFNKALDLFSTNIVTPIYYVFFTTATISASAILFGGITGADSRNLVSILCGFLTIFVGVFMLNSPKRKAESFTRLNDKSLLHNLDEDTLGFSGVNESLDSLDSVSVIRS